MADVTVVPSPARAGTRTSGPASGTDLFPLTPNWPIHRERIDRKVRLQMDSGEWFIRSKGDDLRVFELEGRATSSEIETLLGFYEDHAKIGCRFRDAGFTRSRDVRVQFASTPAVNEAFFNHFSWNARLVETRTT